MLLIKTSLVNTTIYQCLPCIQHQRTPGERLSMPCFQIVFVVNVCWFICSCFYNTTPRWRNESHRDRSHFSFVTVEVHRGLHPEESDVFISFAFGCGARWCSQLFFKLLLLLGIQRSCAMRCVIFRWAERSFIPLSWFFPCYKRPPLYYICLVLF